MSGLVSVVVSVSVSVSVGFVGNLVWAAGLYVFSVFVGVLQAVRSAGGLLVVHWAVVVSVKKIFANIQENQIL